MHIPEALASRCPQEAGEERQMCILSGLSMVEQTEADGRAPRLAHVNHNQDKGPNQEAANNSHWRNPALGLSVCGQSAKNGCYSFFYFFREYATGTIWSAGWQRTIFYLALYKKDLSTPGLRHECVPVKSNPSSLPSPGAVFFCLQTGNPNMACHPVNKAPPSILPQGQSHVPDFCRTSRGHRTAPCMSQSH